MKRMLSVLAVLAFCSWMHGQTGCLPSPWDCIDTIPSSAIVISSTQTLTADSTCFWVCPGDTLRLSGSFNTVYVEPYGAIILASGTENALVLKDSSYFFIDSTASNCRAVLAVGVSGTSYCTGSQVTLCGDPVSLNYDDAPAGGCAVGIKALRVIELTTRPNPTLDRVYIDGLPANVQSISVTDVVGRAVEIEVSTGGWIETKGLPDGQYFIQAYSSRSKMYSGGFVLQR